MNSKKIYKAIIEMAASRSVDACGYYERHHIKPRSMGGSDDASNIAILTAREHYICHWLLYKIHRNRQMASAWFFMRCSSNGMRYVSRTFEYARKYHALHMTGMKLSDQHREKIRLAGLGRIGTETQKEAAAKSNKERKWTPEMREKASTARRGVFTRGAHQRARKVVIVDSGEIFQCMTDLADRLGVTKASIQNAITRKGKCKGLKIEYYNPA